MFCSTNNQRIPNRLLTEGGIEGIQESCPRLWITGVVENLHLFWTSSYAYLICISDLHICISYVFSSIFSHVLLSIAINCYHLKSASHSLLAAHKFHNLRPQHPKNLERSADSTHSGLSASMCQGPATTCRRATTCQARCHERFVQEMSRHGFWGSYEVRPIQYTIIIYHY